MGIPNAKSGGPKAGGAIHSIATMHTTSDEDARSTIKADGPLSVTFSGPGCRWTFSGSGSGVHVYILVKGPHAYILCRDAGEGYTLSTTPGVRYGWNLCDRLLGEQKHRMIKDINQYDGYSDMTEYYVGFSTATADCYVQAIHKDIKLAWAQDWRKPAMDGSEAVCLLYVLNMCHHIGVLRDVKPFDAEAWSAEDMRKIITFLDPHAPNGKRLKRGRDNYNFCTSFPDLE